MTPARYSPPPDADITIKRCANHLRRHTDRGALLLAPVNIQNGPTGCLILLPDGHTQIIHPGGRTANAVVSPDIYRQIRVYHQLTQTQLADLLHVTPNTVANKENGRSKIRHTDILALAHAIKNK